MLQHFLWRTVLIWTCISCHLHLHTFSCQCSDLWNHSHCTHVDCCYIRCAVWRRESQRCSQRLHTLIAITIKMSLLVLLSIHQPLKVSSYRWRCIMLHVEAFAANTVYCFTPKKTIFSKINRSYVAFLYNIKTNKHLKCLLVKCEVLCIKCNYFCGHKCLFPTTFKSCWAQVSEHDLPLCFPVKHNPQYSMAVLVNKK